MKIFFRAFTTTALLFSFSLGFEVHGQRRGPVRNVAPPPAALSLEAQRRIEAFNLVWKTINDHYFDATFNGLDWLAVKTEVEPRVRRARSDAEAHDLMIEMIGRLRVSHLAIIPPDVFEAIELARAEAKEREEQRARDAEANGDGEDADEEELDDPLALYGIGVDVRIIDNKFVITRVEPGSSGMAAGLSPGHIISAINDVDLSELLDVVSVRFPGNERVRRYLPFEIVSYFLNGEKGSSVKIDYVDGSDKQQEAMVERVLLRTQTVHLGNGFPISQLTFRSRDLTEHIGYVRFDSFSLPVITEFCTALREFDGKTGLIIDLRGNVGGIIGVVIGLSGMLSASPVPLGVSIYRHGNEAVGAMPKALNFRGDIAILIDELSISAAEMFTAALQDSGRATIVGQTSAGETLPSVSVPLPTGATLMYPIANFRTPKGRFLEGIGVVPDEVVRLDRDSLLKGIDAQVEAAVSLLNKQRVEGRKTAIPPPPPPAPRPPPVSGRGSGGPPAPGPPPARAVPKDPPNLATVTVVAPPPPKEPPPSLDPKAGRILERFAEKSGSVTRFETIESYAMRGRMELFQMGSRNLFDYRVFRSGKDKFAEIMFSDMTGEIKDVRDGKTMHIRSDFGMEQLVPLPVPVTTSEPISGLLRAMKSEGFKSLEYVGTFDREGRKVHLISGESREGISIAMVFDVETEMLSGFEAGQSGMSFSDYRTVGDLMLPYRFKVGSMIDIELDEIELDIDIEPEIFRHREKCFDRAGRP